MAEVLYRKHRPTKFSDLYGQDAQVKILKTTIASEKPAHAYLFTGPRGTGKTSTARIFAKALNCISPEKGEPCLKCVNCISVTSGQFMDIIEIDAASNRGINEIRELKEKVAFAPAQGKYKVYIIDEVHMLTREAFNAILKTLEEPPLRTIFILATTEVYKLLPTILSRVVRIDFRLASVDTLVEKLTYITKEEGVKVTPEGIALIAKLGRGSFRDSESLLEKVIASSGKKSGMGEDEVRSALGMANWSEVEMLVSSTTQNNLTTNDLVSRLSEVQQSGVSPQQFLTDVAELCLGLVISNEPATNKRKVFALIKMSQDLQKELNYYLDPWLAIKLQWLGLISEEAVVVLERQKFTGNIAPQTIQAPESKGVAERVKKNITSIADNNTSHLEKTTSKSNSRETSNSTEGIPHADSSYSQSDQNFVGADDTVLKRFVELIKSQNPRLAAMVNQGRLVQSESSYKLMLPYKFHLQQLQQVKNRQFLVTSFVQIVGDSGKLDFGLADKTSTSISSATAQETTSAKNTSGSSISPSYTDGSADSKDQADAIEEIFADLI